MSESTHETSETSETTSATRRYDRVSHITWLEFDGKPSDELRSALKEHGWRWSGYRKQWYCNRYYTWTPNSVVVTDGGECDYSAERAERLQARADKHAAASTVAYERSNALVAMIPLGQPILVGHHSERADRNRRAKSWRAMDKSVAEADAAKRLRERAEASAAHQAHKDTPEAMQRRVERLSAELRKWQRNVWTGEAHAEWEQRVARIEADISELKQRITDAGGTKADKLAAAGNAAEVGDTVRIHGFVGVIQRVNKKTYTVKLSRDGWTLKLDKTRLQEVLVKRSA